VGLSDRTSSHGRQATGLISLRGQQVTEIGGQVDTKKAHSCFKLTHLDLRQPHDSSGVPFKEPGMSERCVGLARLWVLFPRAPRVDTCPRDEHHESTHVLVWTWRRPCKCVLGLVVHLWDCPEQAQADSHVHSPMRAE
jgi:hypothetical protein